MYRFRIIWFTLFNLACLSSTGQDFTKNFKFLLTRNDTAGQRRLLLEWESNTPNDPELYIAYFNYYANASIKGVTSFDKNKQADSAFSVSDSTGMIKGYLGFSKKFNYRILQKGFDYIDKGISENPDRLDMRFGKIYMLGQIQDFDEFTAEIMKSICHADSIHFNWKWTYNEPKENAEKFFMETIQEYVNTIYNTGKDDLLQDMRKIAETVLKYNSNNAESLSNIGIALLGERKYDNALEYLLRAEKLSPKSLVVLNNIAITYKRKGDRRKAKKYYEKITQVGNVQETLSAEQSIRDL